MYAKQPTIKPANPNTHVDMRGTKSGGLPLSMIMSKFEETDTGDIENLVDYFQRSTLTDMRPDRNYVAYEEPRDNSEHRRERLNLHYNGTRGEADYPIHSEMMLGFAGPEDVDPLGVANEPDMKKFTKMNQDRMRFKRMDIESDQSTTSGSMSENSYIALAQNARKAVYDRLKVFSTSIDGLRHGLTKSFHKVSPLKNTVVERADDTFMRKITDMAMQTTPRPSVYYGNLTGVDTSVADSAFQVAQVAKCMGRATKINGHRVRNDTMADTAMADSRRRETYKHLILTMRNAIRANQSKFYGGDLIYADGSVQATLRSPKLMIDDAVSRINIGTDIDYKHAYDSAARKGTPGTKDIGQILREAQRDCSCEDLLLSEQHKFMKSVMPSHNYIPNMDSQKTDIDLQDSDATQSRKKSGEKFIAGGGTSYMNPIDIGDDPTKFTWSYKTNTKHIKGANIKDINVSIDADSDLSHRTKMAHKAITGASIFARPDTKEKVDIINKGRSLRIGNKNSRTKHIVSESLQNEIIN